MSAQWTAAGLAAIAFAGVALLLRSSGGGEAATQPAPPADPHGAEGIAGGPEVAAAFSERLAALEARRKAAPDDRAVVLELARLLHDGHRTAEAIPLYERAIELDSADAQTYYDLASAHAALADWGAARAVLRRRLEDAPSDAVAMYDLGAVEANAGDALAASTWWGRARDAARDAELRAQIDASLARLGTVPDLPRPR
jgi:tetratricopeptide (TPR) repeat protein